MDKQQLMKTWGIAIALVTMTFSAAFDAALNAGLAERRSTPAAVALDSDTRAHLLSAAKLLESTALQVDDLHRGIAPRDMNMTPQWAAIRQSLDKVAVELGNVRQALNHNSRQNERLGFELEDTRHLRPQPQPPDVPASAWWQGTFDRFAGWFDASS